MEEKDLDDLVMIVACNRCMVARASAKGDRGTADALIEIGSAILTAWCLQLGLNAEATHARSHRFLEVVTDPPGVVH